MSVQPETALERAEELAERVLPARSPKRRMLVIVNPYATTVSDRLKNLVVYALQSRYAVEAVDTEARLHAQQICREAASEGYDVVVAFGGDGTVNEAANGLIGSGTPLTCLPGGATNVFCRILGIPHDVVDATEHLLRMADDFRPRQVDTGRVDDRHFVFGSGIGLDASVVDRVDAHPRLKTRLGEYYFTYAALSTFNRRYLVRPPRVRVESGGRSVEGVTVIVQNADPFTFFGNRPIRISEPGELDDGSLAMTVLKRATPLELPTLIPRIFSARPGSVERHRQVEGFPRVSEAVVTSIDDRTFPLQVDGDFLGEFSEVRYAVAPRALAVVS
jgi:diacylglycerol kinase family enzyme